jgi:hypothetical protein
MLDALGYAQIPLLAIMLLCASLTKVGRALQVRSLAAGLGPTSMFPKGLRPWAALALCGVEFGLGAGLILTSGLFGSTRAADVVRIGTALLFVVATCTLIEVRSLRPDLGCGCFGELSATPITARHMVRSLGLAVVALVSIYVPRISLSLLGQRVGWIGLFLAAELALFALLSPEVRDVLVRIGYSLPCEMRMQSADQTLAALTRSAQWRKHSALIASDEPSDVWRELCWRYATFPSNYPDRKADLVFAVHLQHRRPAVLSVLVDTATGDTLPWPAGAARRTRFGRPRRMNPPVTSLSPQDSRSAAQRV